MDLKRLCAAAAVIVAVMLTAYIPKGNTLGVFADAGVKGDVNADGSFDTNDIILMQNWLKGASDAYISDWEAGDLCEDGCLNIFDLCIMKHLLVVSPKADEGKLIAPSVTQLSSPMPTTGNVRVLSLYIDFADTKYSEEDYSAGQIEKELFGDGDVPAPYESVSAWYERSSYGNLHIDGDVYCYTCRGSMEQYSQGQHNYEPMIMEALQGLDDQINYGDYDSNHDGVIDCITFTVPLDNASDEMKKFWYAGTICWFYNSFFTVDGMRVYKYSILDVMPNAEDMLYLKQTMIHEMGHMLGLPDYYKYTDDKDSEGLHGAAGDERMDDSIADFCGFSKLMYGWLKDTQVQHYKGDGVQSFMLDDASKTGSCLILPINSSPDNYTSEYFLIEYVTATENNADMYENDSGVRIFHVRADQFYGMFTYCNLSPFYKGDDKERVLRLVNDGGGFYHSGDVALFGTPNFAAYDNNGDQTIDTGYTVWIGDLTDGKYSVTVMK